MNDLSEHKKLIEARIVDLKAQNLGLDMTRGKPAPAQLDLSNALLDNLSQQDYKDGDGTDCRNYGGLDGLPEVKKLFADYMEVSPSEIIIGGSASLPLMSNTLLLAMYFGVPGSKASWAAQADKDHKIKFLCPVPGYDRHFAICEHLGIEMINVPMTDDGPDMDIVEKLVAEDEKIKGIWCVPKYSNPTGCVYSDDTVKRLASMSCKAEDFRIFWDNAYAVHHLNGTIAPLLNGLQACKDAGNANRIIMFGSTSKITFAGAGIGVTAASEENIAWLKKHLSSQTIGPDKINQLRHLRFFKTAEGINQHMQQHADILQPKFQAVLDVLDEQLAGKQLNGKPVATWTKPEGGYFISLDTQPGLAREVIDMAAGLGVKLTPAGATFPYGVDEKNQNIRIAPSFPNIEDVKKATEVLATCILSATLNQ